MHLYNSYQAFREKLYWIKLLDLWIGDVLNNGINIYACTCTHY